MRSEAIVELIGRAVARARSGDVEPVKMGAYCRAAREESTESEVVVFASRNLRSVHVQVVAARFDGEIFIAVFNVRNGSESVPIEKVQGVERWTEQQGQIGA